eukprot:TRINITY_DN3_c0_g2_i1.p1 TRINITY_DN3_c0_g2~~TRINITY_DN3_c0_g2_i1.p1  ORF type:complete len:413 (+),score=74.98 TRINITY_DN3_c0_g2_i1:63-1301(+)
MSRPVVTIQLSGKGDKPNEQVALPAVFLAPIRLDVVHQVHTNVSKNRRQPHGVTKLAGHQTSAESWGTGRAVARIPRVPGGGTSRSGQGAFGNMCRGGRMFSPIKTWRKWKRKTNLNQRRYAISSALAAAAVPAIVQARGHRVSQVPEIPLVISAEAAKAVTKSSKAVELLKSIGAYEDIEKAKDSIRHRAGKGKLRNRRYKKGLGPLIVFGDNLNGNLVRNFRNLPGVEVVNVNYLNILQLAPGAHLGRFVVWLDDAFKHLDKVFGTPTEVSASKLSYKPPRSMLANPNVRRIINSYEIQSVARLPPKVPRRAIIKQNPLKHYHALLRLNPFVEHTLRKKILRERENKKKKEALLQAIRSKDKTYLENKKKEKETQKQRHAQSKTFRKLLLDTPIHPSRPKYERPQEKKAE